MTAIAMNYVVNPLGKFYKRFERFMTVIGYSKAAAELARMGYHEESKSLMMEIQKLHEESKSLMMEIQKVTSE